MFKRIAAALKLSVEVGLGYALFGLGGLAIGVGVQMSWWPLAVLGIIMVLVGFWLVGL